MWPGCSLVEGGLVVRSLEGGLWCPSGRMVLDKGLEIIVDELRYTLHWRST